MSRCVGDGTAGGLCRFGCKRDNYDSCVVDDCHGTPLREAWSSEIQALLDSVEPTLAVDDRAAFVAKWPCGERDGESENVAVWVMRDRAVRLVLPRLVEAIDSGIAAKLRALKPLKDKRGLPIFKREVGAAKKALVAKHAASDTNAIQGFEAIDELLEVDASANDVGSALGAVWAAAFRRSAKEERPALMKVLRTLVDDVARTSCLPETMGKPG